MDCGRGLPLLCISIGAVWAWVWHTLFPQRTQEDARWEDASWEVFTHLEDM